MKDKEETRGTECGAAVAGSQGTWPQTAKTKCLVGAIQCYRTMRTKRCMWAATDRSDKQSTLGEEEDEEEHDGREVVDNDLGGGGGSTIKTSLGAMRKEQDKPYQDRHGNWKQAWPYNVKGNGQTVCGITYKDGKMCGQKECKRRQKTRKCGHCQDRR